MEGRPLYRTVAALGLGAHALSSLIHVVLVSGGDKVFFAIILAIAAAAAFTVTKWANGLWVSLVAGLLLELATFWFVFPLFQGFAVSALDAVPALIGFVGVWTAIIASIRGVMKRREGREFSDATKRKVMTAVATIVALGIVSTALTFMNKKSVSADEAAGAVEVLMHNGDEFSPTTIDATAGEQVKLLVRNDDPFAHTFDMDDDESDISEIVGPGSEVLLTYTPTKAGRYEYFCEFHEAMKGHFVVK